MRHSLGSHMTAALVAAAFASGTPASASKLSVRALAEHDVRLARIVHRIGTANATACARPQAMTGLVLHDLTQYEPSARAAVSRAFSLHSGFGVLGVVPGSAADSAGLQVDDEIVAVGSVSVENAGALQGRTPSYRRLDQFVSVVERALTGGATTLSVRRGGRLMRVHLRAESGCGGHAALTDSSKLDAWSDGRRVVLSTGMISFARTDDELAFVVAHEMAHNILGHSTGESRGFLGFAQARQAEGQADAYAIGLMNRAGYSGGAANVLLEKLRRRLWWNVSLTHPGFGRRIQIVKAAMANQQPWNSRQVGPARPAKSIVQASAKGAVRMRLAREKLLDDSRAEPSKRGAAYNSSGRATSFVAARWNANVSGSCLR